MHRLRAPATGNNFCVLSFTLQKKDGAHILSFCDANAVLSENMPLIVSLSAAPQLWKVFCDGIALVHDLDINENHNSLNAIIH